MMHPFLAFVLISVAVIVPAYYLSKHTCSKQAEVYETEYHYGFFEGCFLERDGRFIHKDHYRYIQGE